MTFVKAILLIIGGLALGFFGCLGGLTLDNKNTPYIVMGSLVAGAIMALWGTVKLFIALIRGFTKVVRSSDSPAGPPPPA